MIRGILLLILSCVVLTLQTQCTCEDNARASVLERAADFYPINAAKNVAFTTLPDDAADLVTKYAKMNGKTFIKDTTSVLMATLQAEAKTMIATVTAQLDALVALKQNCLAEIDLVKLSVIADRIHLGDLVETIRDPLPAINHCTRPLYILSRQQYIARLTAYLDLQIKVKTNVKALWITYGSLTDTAFSLLKSIEALLGGCKLLGPVLCSKDGILSTLTDPLKPMLANGLVEFGKSLTNFQTNLRLDLAASANILVDLTPADIVHNALRVQLFANIELLEHLGVRAFVDLQASVAALSRSPANFFALVGVQLNGFVLTGGELLCVGYSDPKSEQITLTLVSKLTVDPSVTAAVDINVAVAKLVHICRVVTLALTASLHVDVELLNIAADGTFSVQITIPRFLNELKQTIYQLPEVVNQCGIDSIINSGEVNQNLLSCLTENDALQDVASLESKLQQLGGQVVQKVTEATDLVVSVTKGFESCEDSNTVLSVDRSIALDAIKIQVDPVEQCRLASIRCNASKTEELHVLRTSLVSLELNKASAEAKVASCKRDLIQAKVALVKNPNNPHVSDNYPKLHSACIDSLKAELQVLLQVTALSESVQAKIDIAANALVSLSSTLQAKLDGIVGAIVPTIAALRVDITLHLNLYIDLCVSIITGFRPGCQIVDLVFTNIEDIASTHIEVLVTLKDQPIGLEQITDMIDCHKSLIQASLSLCTQRIDIQVHNIVSATVDLNAIVYSVKIGAI